jgi:hypothetical protein
MGCKKASEFDVMPGGVMKCKACGKLQVVIDAEAGLKALKKIFEGARILSGLPGKAKIFHGSENEA